MNSMNSMNFTKTELKKKKPIIHGTNNMGKYYNNERLPIKKFTYTSISDRIDDILQNLRLTKLTIENVYQEKYGDVNASGIGDFLRGSYFLLQFCEQFNFSYNINILNHPISQFLEIYQHEKPSVYSNISIFLTRNFNPVLLEDGILSNTYNYKINIYFLYFLYFHICKIDDKSVIINKNGAQQNYDKKIYTYIISYPNTPIKEKHKLYMQQLLKPTTEFLSIINNTLHDLGLVQKEFVVIHIRYGDKFLLKNDENIDLEHIKIIDKSIELLDPAQQVLLISDNTIIKDLIVKKYPFIKSHFNEITHTGEGVEINSDKLKNTMLDFYLFSFAEKIFAFSVYFHGTGFSKWVAETYSIPYVCRFLH